MSHGALAGGAAHGGALDFAVLVARHRGLLRRRRSLRPAGTRAGELRAGAALGLYHAYVDYRPERPSPFARSGTCASVTRS
jgi:hypothetical protein